jgi:hypothetical protein
MLQPGIFKTKAMAAGNFRSNRSKDGLMVRDKMGARREGDVGEDGVLGGVDETTI